MYISMETIEAKLAINKIHSMEKRGFGYFAQVSSATKLLIGQGFGKEYSKKVAEAAYDALFN